MKNLSFKIVLAFALLAPSLLVLSACESIVHEPSHISESRVQVEEETFFEDVSAAEMDEGYIAALSKHYSRHGDGDVGLTVTYDPRSKTSTAMTASNEIARIRDVFHKNGVDHVATNIMPVKGQGSDSRVLISYNSYNALAPEDCGLMPGLRDLNVDHDEEYKIGCTVETLFARQIARPKDLQGSESSGTTGGRRASNIVESYRTGARNGSLEGESASDN